MRGELRRVLALVLTLAVVAAGLCVLDDHAGIDSCLVLLAVAAAIAATVVLVVVLGGVHASVVGCSRFRPQQARPAPI